MWASLAGVFLAIAGSLVARILIALGVGAVSFTGIQLLVNQLKNIVMQNLNGLDGALVGIIGMLQIHTCVNMIFSAIIIRFTLAGLRADGGISKMVLKGK